MDSKTPYKPLLTFNAKIHVLVQPHLHAASVLQISEDEVDGLHHHLLYLSIALERHVCSKYSLLDRAITPRNKRMQNVNKVASSC